MGERELSPIEPITSAELWISASNGSKYIWKISDPKELSRIAAFVDSRRTGWSTPWYGVPVPTVEVRFFNAQQTRGSFGVGKDFFETQRDDAFFSKKATPGEISSFYAAANVDDATLKEFAK
jgi:hypothetical protein